jgi:hypothetical protein
LKHPASIAYEILGELLHHVGAVKSPEGKGLSHARWMAIEVTCMEDEEKMHRWVGYIQAMLIYEGVSTLEREMERNR